MNLRTSIAAAALFALLTSGCQPQTSVSTGFGNIIDVQNDRIAVRAPSQPDAEIMPTGELGIDGQRIEITPAQRALLKRYHDTALALQDEAVATGAAGAKLGGQAVSSVVNGLLSGKPDDIGKHIEASAGDVAAKALGVCRQLVALQQVQDDLARALPAFRPYATLKGKQDKDCSVGSSSTATGIGAVPGHRARPLPP